MLLFFLVEEVQMLAQEFALHLWVTLGVVVGCVSQWMQWTPYVGTKNILEQKMSTRKLKCMHLFLIPLLYVLKMSS